MRRGRKAALSQTRLNSVTMVFLITEVSKVTLSLAQSSSQVRGLVVGGLKARNTMERWANAASRQLEEKDHLLFSQADSEGCANDKSDVVIHRLIVVT